MTRVFNFSILLTLPYFVGDDWMALQYISTTNRVRMRENPRTQASDIGRLNERKYDLQPSSSTFDR